MLVSPILGLQAKYTEADFDVFARTTAVDPQNKRVVVSLANLLYKINLDDKDKTLLYKSLKKNKQFLASTGTEKKNFNVEIFDTVSAALEYKYNN